VVRGGTEMNEYNLFRILEFSSRMAQAEIKMNGMVAENKQREIMGESMAYIEDDFVRLIDEYQIHDNAVPRYEG
jgi:hypothetical protein